MQITRRKQMPEYNTWSNMKSRCLNPKDAGYKDYGGRGITVCKRWQESFLDFLADMGPKTTPDHSIDRIDNNGNYEPGNCRWADDTTQARNSRHNRILIHQGRSMCISEWAEAIGMTKDQLWNRINRGWDIERALTEPLETRTYIHRITYNGQTKTIREWSDVTGLSLELIHFRWKKGLPLDEVFSPKKKSLSEAGKAGGKSRWENPHTLTHKGITKTISQWAKDLGIPYGRMLNRFLKNYPVEQILSHDKISFSDAGKMGVEALRKKKKA